MVSRLSCLLIFMSAACSLSIPANGTTSVQRKLACPVCGTVNTYNCPTSCGGYIYIMPSKFQYVFFPLTDSGALYSCRKCHLCCWGWDAEHMPKGKAKATGIALRRHSFDPDKTDDIGQRLRAAEVVYVVLKGRSDDEFWSRFYRVEGYFLSEAGRQAEANQARAKALKVTQRMLGRKENSGRRKELLLISGAMRHYLGSNEAALRDFNAALKLTYCDKRKPKASNVCQDEYLTKLLKEYIQKLRPAPNTPRGSAKDSLPIPSAFICVYLRSYPNHTDRA